MGTVTAMSPALGFGVGLRRWRCRRWWVVVDAIRPETAITKTQSPSTSWTGNAPSGVLLSSIVTCVYESDCGGVETMHQQHSDDGEHGQSGHQYQTSPAYREDHRPS